MKLNVPELTHYILGAILLIGAWLPLMWLFGNNVILTSIVWTIWYIVIDQILHVVVKREKINIIR